MSSVKCEMFNLRGGQATLIKHIFCLLMSYFESPEFIEMFYVWGEGKSCFFYSQPNKFIVFLLFLKFHFVSLGKDTTSNLNSYEIFDPQKASNLKEQVSSFSWNTILKLKCLNYKTDCLLVFFSFFTQHRQPKVTMRGVIF